MNNDELISLMLATLMIVSGGAFILLMINIGM